jgi:hypothetical protein
VLGKDQEVEKAENKVCFLKQVENLLKHSKTKSNNSKNKNHLEVIRYLEFFFNKTGKCF